MSIGSSREEVSRRWRGLSFSEGVDAPDAPGGGEGAMVVDLNREPESCGWSVGNNTGISEFCLALCSFVVVAFLHSADETTSFFSCERELGVLGSKFDMVGVR